jgi:hypothetical protein
MAMLYSCEGVNVALVSVEVWSAGVIVRLAGLTDEQRETLESNYHETLEARDRGGREGSPPNQPAGIGCLRARCLSSSRRGLGSLQAHDTRSEPLLVRPASGVPSAGRAPAGSADGPSAGAARRVGPVASCPGKDSRGNFGRLLLPGLGDPLNASLRRPREIPERWPKRESSRLDASEGSCAGSRRT